MLVIQIISILIAIAIFGIGLITLLRNPQSLHNRVFFVVCVLSTLWGLIFGSIERYNNISFVVIANSMAYALGLMLLLSVVYFSTVFPVQTKSNFIKYYSILVVPVLVLCFTPLVAGHVSGTKETGYHFVYGALTNLYNAVMASGIIAIGYYVFSKRKKYTTVQKDQSRFVAYGFILSFIFGVGLSTVLPLINDNTKLDNLAPFSLIFLAGFTSFAIVKHKLFDFKAVVARAAAYLLTTTILVIAYVGLAFIAKKILFPEIIVTTPQLVSNVALSVLLVVSFPYIKRGFDKFTNRFFFRDAYDPQLFLDELNKTLVSSLEIGELLQKSSGIIDANLKSQSCSFYIRDTSYFSSRLLGDNQAKITDDEMRRIQDLLIKVHKKVISAALEGDTPEESEIIDILKKHNIEILARLVSTLDFEVAGIGYFVLGSKRSGNLYSSQDVKIIEIVANELVIAVENALRFEEIEQFNVTLQKKIDDATKALKKSNTKLLALDEAKDEFISMASHQLRTPLTSVKGYLSMLSEGDAGKLNETQRKFIDQAFISSQRMVYLIADLLNVSRLKTGKFIIEAAPTYLPDVIESEIAQLNETVKSRGLTMKYDKPKEFPMLNLDETKIRQVIMNFTDNAIYYTKAGGTIVVSLKQINDVAEFTVKDDGIGVPKSEQQHLFTKFYRAGNARKTRPDGTGLGLFMAKKVVVAQGGALIFNSTEGKGSTFGFRFTISDKKTDKALAQ